MLNMYFYCMEFLVFQVDPPTRGRIKGVKSCSREVLLRVAVFCLKSPDL
jgi:hypothetical protein